MRGLVRKTKSRRPSTAQLTLLFKYRQLTQLSPALFLRPNTLRACCPCRSQCPRCRRRLRRLQSLFDSSSARGASNLRGWYDPALALRHRHRFRASGTLHSPTASPTRRANRTLRLPSRAPPTPPTAPPTPPAAPHPRPCRGRRRRCGGLAVFRSLCFNQRKKHGLGPPSLFVHNLGHNRSVPVCIYDSNKSIL